MKNLSCTSSCFLLQQVARLRESVDLPATINNFNQTQIPEIIGLIVDNSLLECPNFGQIMTHRVRNYVRQLFAIIIHCCQDGVQGFDAIVLSYVVSISIFSLSETIMNLSLYFTCVIYTG